RAFQKAGLTLPLHHYPVVLRRTHVFEFYIAGEDAFYRTHTCAQRSRVARLAGAVELLAAWNAPLQHFGIDKRSIDAFPAGAEFLASFDFHLIVARRSIGSRSPESKLHVGRGLGSSEIRNGLGAYFAR